MEVKYFKSVDRPGEPGPHYYKQTETMTVHILALKGHELINTLDTDDIVSYRHPKKMVEVSEEEFNGIADSILAYLTLKIDAHSEMRK